MDIACIMKRKSVRSYSAEPIKKVEQEKLLDYLTEINHSKGVFGNKIRLQYMENNGSSNEKLGTYGVIRGARFFVAAACKKAAAYSLEDTGYLFEKMILFATDLGLGTVILGGTFGRGGFSRAISLAEDEALPVVTPIGYAGDKKSLLGRLIKSNAGNRKPSTELFFDGDFSTLLAADDEYAEVLEAVRQAPSAINGQPWRIVKEGGTGFHFYSAGQTEMSRIDMGIAICHFEIAAKEKGFTGQFQVLNRKRENNLKYLVSWVQS